MTSLCRDIFYTPNAPLYGGLVPGHAARSFVLELKSMKRRNEVTDQREEVGAILCTCMDCAVFALRFHKAGSFEFSCRA